MATTTTLWPASSTATFCADDASRAATSTLRLTLTLRRATSRSAACARRVNCGAAQCLSTSPSAACCRAAGTRCSTSAPDASTTAMWRRNMASGAVARRTSACAAPMTMTMTTTTITITITITITTRTMTTRHHSQCVCTRRALPKTSRARSTSFTSLSSTMRSNNSGRCHCWAPPSIP